MHRLRMMGQTWTVRVHGSTSLLQRVDRGLPIVIAVTGVLLSAMLAGLMFLLVSGRSRAEAAARAMTEDLSLERSRLSAILEGTRVGTWEWNVQSGETVFNEEWARIVGYKLQELEPISIVTWAKLTHPEDLQKSEQLLKQHLAGELPFYECEARMRHKDGHWIWVLDRGKVGKWDRDGKPLIMYGTHQDISRSRQELDTYHHRAHHDVLTDLPNRVLLGDRIQQALALAKRENTHLAVLFMDLDGFKSVNDTHGHEVGDRLLVEIARRMRAALRDVDTVARLGGDEFAAIFTDLAAASASEPLIERLLGAIAAPVVIDGLGLQVSGSIGVSYFPQQGDLEAEQLLRQADHAMYAAKLSGRNRCCVFVGEGDEGDGAADARPRPSTAA